MSEVKKRKKVKKGVKTKEERAIEEEAAEVTRPGAEGKGVEEATPEERPPLKHTILMQLMKDSSFRTRVIYHLVKKLR